MKRLFVVFLEKQSVLSGLLRVALRVCMLIVMARRSHWMVESGGYD